MGFYDPARDALHAVVTHVPLEPRPRRSGHGQRLALPRHAALLWWYALNVAELPPHVIALHLGHDDGGQLVRELYGHPDAALARERTREAFRSIASVSTLRPAATASG
jgi:hypothetical protein